MWPRCSPGQKPAAFLGERRLIAIVQELAVPGDVKTLGIECEPAGVIVPEIAVGVERQQSAAWSVAVALYSLMFTVGIVGGVPRLPSARMSIVPVQRRNPLKVFAVLVSVSVPAPPFRACRGR